MKSINQCNEKPLADAVRACLDKKDMTVQQAAGALNISSIHLSSLLNGARRFSGLSPDKQDRLSAFLSMRKSEMFVLCGLLSPEDLLPNTNAERVQQTLRHIQADPELRLLCLHDADIDNASDRVKLLLAVLYEKAITASMRPALTNEHEVTV